jgi:glycosyltransferase involved in cell wall biosynthesis
MGPLVSVIIPTFKRAPFLKYALESLKKQSYKNFEIIVVFKPGGDQTEKLLEQYRFSLPIKIIKQHSGFVTKAYNLGLSKADGEIILFLDDDSIPEANWIQKYLDVYGKNGDLGGVSGAALCAKISKNGELTLVPDKGNLMIIWREYYFSRWSYNRPLNGMSNWWIFFGKDGLVHHRFVPHNQGFQTPIPSLLHMGANMSVKRCAIQGLKIDENLVLGFNYEQLLAYQIWRRGYKLLHDSSIKVLHIVHSESLGRFFATTSRAAHRESEYILSFFILKLDGNEVSWIPYLLELMALLISRASSAKKYGVAISTSRIYGLVYGFVVGCAFYISKKLGGNFSLETALNRFIKKLH